MYATPEDYARLYGAAPEGVERALQEAQRDIDALTFNRITVKGFDNLTGFQRELVTEAVCAQAEFLQENRELLDSPLASYGINGVSMAFDAKRVQTISGVTAPNRVISLLRQTGLACRRLS